jgi:hypothetical protein
VRKVVVAGGWRREVAVPAEPAATPDVHRMTVACIGAPLHAHLHVRIVQLCIM